MSDEPTTASPLVMALTKAAGVGGHAPSMHNTQPWRWRAQPDRLELRAVRDRQLSVGDPDGRMLTISCGAALHHARVALAALGWSFQVRRLPDLTDPDLLAVIGDLKQGEPDEAAIVLRAAIEVRHTDRRPVAEQRVPPSAVEAVRRAVGDEGALLQILNADQTLDLAAEASRAAQIQEQDRDAHDELTRWAGGGAVAGTGIDPSMLPDRAAQTTVPLRDFGAGGTLPSEGGHDRWAGYGILYGPGDEPLDWLRAGEGLSAGWLTAETEGLSLLPMSWVAEVPGTRESLRRLIAEAGMPYLALRLGVGRPPAVDPEAGPAPVRRIPAEQLIEVVAGP
ncbi:Acg family FMN-binding oxidoreductase [Pilimelia columellifera]|uniref:NAD(P)H nitroreductase n=1 Tax=Pilimelia columellifera subsp. columellifera TaxID=706583 RepID=A0ABP6AYQ8_9ACTN